MNINLARILLAIIGLVSLLSAVYLIVSGTGHWGWLLLLTLASIVGITEIE